MQQEIGNAGVIGFVPTKYPAGIVLVETWRYDLRRIEWVTGTVDNIDTAEEWSNGHYFNNVQDAIDDLVARAKY